VDYWRFGAKLTGMEKKVRIITDPVESARAVGLRYVSDGQPGIRQVRDGNTFRYLTSRGRQVVDPSDLGRIKSLAIPPAWTEVWISPIPNGHLQATGRDARGRKQYRYHRRWREVRDETKYNRMLLFGKVLPKIRKRVRHDLRLPGLPREKVLAAVVRLLEVSLIRVGNDEYKRNNGSYGLTTMQDKHAKVSGSKVRFSFRGKSGRGHAVEIDHARLARIVRRCQELPGQELFQCIDDSGHVRDVGSQDVNEYLRQITGQEYTAKDFRTWAGTVLAALALQEFKAVDSQAQAKKNIVRAIEQVSERLGNTPGICRKCYVHPEILDAYLEGATVETLKVRAEARLRESIHRLRPEEAAVLAFLQNRLAAQLRRGDLNAQLKASLALQRRRRAAPRRPRPRVKSSHKSAGPSGIRSSRRQAAWFHR
jgi:DNA topoisomerase-1